MSGKRIFKVSYHGGNLYALVETDLAQRAIDIAKAHRLRKRVFSGHPPKEVLDGHYEATAATERDIAWTASFGGRPLTDMPAKPRKGAPVRVGRAPTPQEGAKAA